ncbi:MAG: hypothetical protein SGPRY_001524 [Prymnesium sp.]
MLPRSSKNVSSSSWATEDVGPAKEAKEEEAATNPASTTWLQSSIECAAGLINRPTLASLLGVVVGSTPPLRSLIVIREAPFRFALDAVELLGAGAIPLIIFVLGGQLSSGPSEVCTQPWGIFHDILAAFDKDIASTHLVGKRFYLISQTNSTDLSSVGAPSNLDSFSSATKLCLSSSTAKEWLHAAAHAGHCDCL